MSPSSKVSRHTAHVVVSCDERRPTNHPRRFRNVRLGMASTTRAGVPRTDRDVNDANVASLAINSLNISPNVIDACDTDNCNTRGTPFSSKRTKYSYTRPSSPASRRVSARPLPSAFKSNVSKSVATAACAPLTAPLTIPVGVASIDTPLTAPAIAPPTVPQHTHAVTSPARADARAAFEARRTARENTADGEDIADEDTVDVVVAPGAVDAVVVIARISSTSARAVVDSDDFFAVANARARSLDATRADDGRRAKDPRAWSSRARSSRALARAVAARAT